ncbi:ATP synthase subunit b, mitochondrial [Bactrocera oleae]|uniref:ATP synthase subunit b, mitochondrial n=1 Tax=Bactrocera oleae TaxID=104688 RepID=UPI0006B8559C|nr:ATP synthase subunit b, mitochondrial [Bactrocera oleae]XP_036220484.1 ATP synthase subunit b, mitochondrial [Bactrocera oleae]XP_036220485.1 ATP synthase subunit b, mitochondrial [Bactrocera oleae]XP_036220487.1 ATP synthase subunit b, mitochondrial [Bactrocera oleae]
MLSRTALLSVQRPLGVLAMRSASAAGSGDQVVRRERPEHPGKVRLGFIPEEWFQFFYNKTGVTGPYTFGVGLLTYLCSKEIYVMEHEYYSGLSLAIMAIVAVKKLGPTVAAWTDKEIDRIENEWKSGREEELQNLADAIEAEKKEQWRAEGALLLMDAKKENIALQLEAAFRERAMNVYNEVKRRLDYQVECRHIDRRINQKHMVNWIVNNVLGSITPQQEKETLDKCIADLSALAVRAK